MNMYSDSILGKFLQMIQKIFIKFFPSPIHIKYVLSKEAVNVLYIKLLDLSKFWRIPLFLDTSISFIFFYRVLALNPREYPKMAGRIYPPWAEIEYGEITLDQLKNGEEVEFQFTVDYAMKSFNSEKDIEVRGHSF